jgi:hypothetical protein
MGAKSTSKKWLSRFTLLSLNPSIRFSVEVREKKKEGVSENLLPRHGQKGDTPCQL